MIIGLTGYKESGKDTAAAYLIKHHKFERRAFADPLKRSVAALLDIPFSEIDKMKNDPNSGIELRGDSDTFIMFRTFLQRYGTESHRDVFGKDFWLDHTLPMNGFYVGKNIVITDVRFENEFARVWALNGFIVGIDRPSSPLMPKDKHPSEDIDFNLPDYIITNDGTFNDLYQGVEDCLEFLITQSDE